jgi:2-polyprenyl-6-methoxyphenol hydroxylase-like FAD-dependent oxidoreductase
MENKNRTTCAVVGGGPAGMVLGLLLARAGVEVTVLEKHADFLRDFRGDTVHASTLTLLDELGLGERFAALPQRRMDRTQVQLDGGTAQVADLGRLPGDHQHIALVPQWDFLDLLADAAEEEPAFTLRRRAEVVGLLRDGGRVVGVRYRDRSDPDRGDSDSDSDREGADVASGEHDLHATLTVACDGRGSAVRAAAGLRPRSFGVPMDVWWFRLPRQAGDPEGGVGRISVGEFMVMIDRGEYWQCGYLIRKGSDARVRAAGIEAFRSRLVRLVPWVADRVDHLRSFDDVRLLDVRLDRLRRWYADGLVFIGDAAHAMSPVGGVGINLAVQDAVAAARLLAPALRAGGPVPRRRLLRVQLRRWWPTALIQGGQRLAHRGLVGRALSRAPDPPDTTTAPAGRPTDATPPQATAPSPAAPTDAAAPQATAPSPAEPQTTAPSPADGGAPLSHGTVGGRPRGTSGPARGWGDPRADGAAAATGLPVPIRVLQRFPALQGVLARLVAIGPLPEHAPSWARRSPEAVRP